MRVAPAADNVRARSGPVGLSKMPARRQAPGRNSATAYDGDWRALNLERAPFGWGSPFELLNENCLEAGGDWRDESLGVWRLATLVKPSLRGA
jgi:hypothetical protein